MECKYFGLCGSCKIYDKGYEGQLEEKVKKYTELFKPLYDKKIDIFRSPESHFRNRAEFRIYKDGERLFYAMTGFDKRPVPIESCQIVNKRIYDAMPLIRDFIENSKVLKERLFAAEFLSTLSDDLLVTLIYHKKLDDEWTKEAEKLRTLASVSLIGRSRKQKIVLGNEYVTERFEIFGKEFVYRQYENAFTQPNGYVNIKMIEWVVENIKDIGNDLLELYCGAGNFTLPMSKYFEKVLATEISKTSIKAARENCYLNGIENITFVRMSSEEISEAFEGKREFRRLKDIKLSEFDIKTVFVDPPRAGLDEVTRELVKNFENIVYISCNPETLRRDLDILSKSHEIRRFAFFDQFPYTPHLECGVFMKRKD
ncbi:tRNA (uridine(54)-C5)-methyltransferase TrmA [Nitrosophilus alvini]|uniref:tRNA (uridine(54)-C5)-methyltransferase TrmA n=1 Tax=Nitrosophilus alvini TaxID=2714855 RepID=UPI00190DB971|nr:tRNA (uridine(54)-C5)-methyltransferase TrmA [Nitrosophilus alvini]